MFKTTIAAAAAAVAFAPAAALAGPYVNVEANASWAGDDYTGATTDIHVGYEGTVGEAGYYVQAGPAIVAAMVLKTPAASLVRQVLAFLSRMHSAHTVSSHSSLQKTSSLMISA